MLPQGNINIKIRSVDSGPPHYGVVIEAPPVLDKLKTTIAVDVSNGESDGQWVNADEPPVLPDNVEFVKIGQYLCPSQPRLQVFDDFLIGGR